MEFSNNSYLFYLCYYIKFALLAPAPVTPTPCKPSPCGPNSLCRPRGDESECSCLPDFIGSPPNCRAECVSNNECPNHLACISQKCQDPCIGSCGANANCHVVSHTPMCSCMNGYTGDPFTQCVFRERKYHSEASITSVIIRSMLWLWKVYRVLSPHINDHFMFTTLQQKSRKLYWFAYLVYLRREIFLLQIPHLSMSSFSHTIATCVCWSLYSLSLRLERSVQGAQRCWFVYMLAELHR